jgi:hypothetical protein
MDNLEVQHLQKHFTNHWGGAMIELILKRNAGLDAHKRVVVSIELLKKEDRCQTDEALSFGLLCVSHLLGNLFCRIKHQLAEFINILEVETENAGREPDAANRFAVEVEDGGSNPSDAFS